jgi:DNA-binding IclR family transcriptional regulator
LHILRVLVAEQLVAFDPDNKKYTYGAGILTIAEVVATRQLR